MSLVVPPRSPGNTAKRPIKICSGELETLCPWTSRKSVIGSDATSYQFMAPTCCAWRIFSFKVACPTRARFEGRILFLLKKKKTRDVTYVKDGVTVIVTSPSVISLPFHIFFFLAPFSSFVTVTNISGNIFLLFLESVLHFCEIKNVLKIYCPPALYVIGCKQIKH